MALVTTLLVCLALLAMQLLTLRLLAILPSRRPKPQPRKRGSPTHLLIVLGSGGHTAEMVSMLRNAVKGRPGNDSPGGASGARQARGAGNNEDKAPLLRWGDYAHRTWIVSSGDGFSADRARELESDFADQTAAAAAAAADGVEVQHHPKQKDGRQEVEVHADAGAGARRSTYDIVTVPRARRIHQPLYTTPLSSLRCLWACVKLLHASPHDLPDLVLANGPATATIVIVATLLLRLLDVRGANRRGKMRTVYVESWARVRKLSLSGRLLARVADRVLVQWEHLDGVAGKGEYLGVLV